MSKWELHELSGSDSYEIGTGICNFMVFEKEDIKEIKRLLNSIEIEKKPPYPKPKTSYYKIMDYRGDEIE